MKMTNAITLLKRHGEIVNLPASGHPLEYRIGYFSIKVWEKDNGDTGAVYLQDTGDWRAFRRCSSVTDAIRSALARRRSLTVHGRAIFASVNAIGPALRLAASLVIDGAPILIDSLAGEVRSLLLGAIEDADGYGPLLDYLEETGAIPC